MSRNARGFSLVELLVTVFVLVLISAATFPCFVSTRHTTREGEVKSNIHSIQIALERRGVDTSGVYPTFLIGADSQCNSIRAQYESQYENSSKIISGATPFAKKADSELADQQNCFITMDPLIKHRYLSKYPINPFAKRDDGMWNGVLSTKKSKPGQFPFGGEHGDLMFDLGFGWGDTPQADFVMHKNEQLIEAQDDGKRIFADPDMDARGNFYYHPLFADMLPVYIHYLAQYNEVYGHEHSPDSSLSSFGIADHKAIGYYLYGFGLEGDSESNIQKGLDIFNRMPANDLRHGDSKFVNIENLVEEFGVECIYELDSTTSNNQKRVETTGYPSVEYDPWTGGYPYGMDPNDPAVSNPKSGSDGVLDWIIIEVTGGTQIYRDPDRDKFQYGGT